MSIFYIVTHFTAQVKIEVGLLKRTNTRYSMQGMKVMLEDSTNLPVTDQWLCD